MAKSLSIIVPAYNEENNIASVVGRIYGFLQKDFRDFEIIVVDDGSTDKTAQILETLVRPAITVLRNSPNQGKGYSLRQGVAAAQKDFILLCDADLSVPLEEVHTLLGYLHEGFDVAIGSRALPDSRNIVRQGFLRRTMGKTFNLFVRLILMNGISDTQCGFKCFKKEAAKKLFACQHIRRFSFDVEILYIARRRGLKIKEAPVTWINRPQSRVVVWKDPWNMFVDLLRIRINAWRGFYDAC